MPYCLTSRDKLFLNRKRGVSESESESGSGSDESESDAESSSSSSSESDSRAHSRKVRRQRGRARNSKKSNSKKKKDKKPAKKKSTKNSKKKSGKRKRSRRKDDSDDDWSSSEAMARASRRGAGAHARFSREDWGRRLHPPASPHARGYGAYEYPDDRAYPMYPTTPESRGHPYDHHVPYYPHHVRRSMHAQQPAVTPSVASFSSPGERSEVAAGNGPDRYGSSASSGFPPFRESSPARSRSRYARAPPANSPFAEPHLEPNGNMGPPPDGLSAWRGPHQGQY